MQYVVGKVQYVCKKYVDSEKLRSIPISGCNLPTSVFAAKNKRRQMEDRHVIVDDLPKLFNKEVRIIHLSDIVVNGRKNRTIRQSSTDNVVHVISELRVN